MEPWNGTYDRVDDHRIIIPRSYKKGMRVDGMVFVNRKLMTGLLTDNALEQVANVAMLPGIVGSSMAMPDIHWGYGFPIGGVAGTDAREGVISPGGVGFDINCGVRVMRTALKAEDITGNIRELLDALYTNVPSGLGSKGRIRVEGDEIDSVLENGAGWAITNGYGRKEDLAHCEENGGFSGVDASTISRSAKKRGRPQIGSLGSGNHFLEVQKVETIYDAEAAKAYGIESPGQVMVMIHTGSRGLGHQVCTDTLKTMERGFVPSGNMFHSSEFEVDVADRQLVCAPMGSQVAQDYFNDMKAAANFAWANRQLITHWSRKAFEDVLGMDAGSLGMDLIYDVAHNIAKEELHTIDGERRRLIVHRKGATRAFGPGREEVPEDYRAVGQPVLVPGDMGSASYILAGTAGAMDLSLGSSCHGAGRAMSRTAARNTFNAKSLTEELARRGITIKAASRNGVVEEAPAAYKDVDQVVETVHGAGIARKVVRLVPIAVMKG